MNALIMIGFGALAYLLGYTLYSKYLAEKVFQLNDQNRTPAVEFEDGIDFVPTNRWILLGHHFTSIAGAGPIVGPAIALIWGWLPALLWVVLGAVLIGAVHDFSSLVVSIRNRGLSVGSIIGNYLGNRARLLFLLVILLLAILVNAVFAYVIAKLLVSYPTSVIPSWVVIPLALAFGFSVYRLRLNFALLSVIFVLLLYLFLFLGVNFPIDVKPLANLLGLTPLMFWILVLFTYTFFASSLPVWLLLQPRDFLNGIQLIVLLALLYLSAVISNPPVKAPLLNLNPEGAPPFFPFLFITIACGALSGFHSLVASGTTSKQLSKESDARVVGYLGFLGESSLGLATIIAVSAGLYMFGKDFSQFYGSWALAKKNALLSVVEGGANLLTSLGFSRELSRTFIATLIVLFSATTMDTSVRIQRYILNELGVLFNLKPLKNLYLSSLIAVLTSMALVLSREGGKGGLIFWPVFGASNQLLAGLAFLVSYLYLRQGGRPTKPILIPMLFVMLTTSYAMLLNTFHFLKKGDALLTLTSLLILTFELWIIFETLAYLRATRGEGYYRGN